MPDRRKFKGRSQVDLGGVAGLLGGSDVVAMEPGDVDYRDSSFNANTQTRFKAAHPVLDFLSGKQGTRAAADLNNPQILADNVAKIQQAKALELANVRQNYEIEQLIRAGKIDEAKALNDFKFKKEIENLTSANKVLAAAGMVPGETGEEAELYRQGVNTAALQTKLAESFKLTSDFNKSMRANDDAEVLRPIQQKTALIGAEFDAANAVGLNQARITDALLKPKSTQADIDLKLQQAKKIYSPTGFGAGSFNEQTGEIARPGDAGARISEAFNASPKAVSPISQFILKILGGGKTSPAPVTNFSRAMDYTPNTFEVKSNMSGYFGQETAPVNIPSMVNVNGIAAAPTSDRGPYNQSSERFTNAAPTPKVEIINGITYIDGIPMRKKAVAPIR